MSYLKFRRIIMVSAFLLALFLTYLAFFSGSGYISYKNLYFAVLLAFVGFGEVLFYVYKAGGKYMGLLFPVLFFVVFGFAIYSADSFFIGTNDDPPVYTPGAVFIADSVQYVPQAKKREELVPFFQSEDTVALNLRELGNIAKWESFTDFDHYIPSKSVVNIDRLGTNRFR
ncbi:MAG: hypothetical protein K8S56_08380, partial [Candidatus Cloacimonetes bacterium]|nr:hypothetical protein [Candidatus Cloacimonadota bacterium]